MKNYRLITNKVPDNQGRLSLNTIICNRFFMHYYVRKNNLTMYDVCTFGQLFRAEKDKRTQDHCHIQHLHSLNFPASLVLVLERLSGDTAWCFSAASSRFYTHHVCGLPLIPKVSNCRHAVLKLPNADSFMMQVGICLRTVSS